MVFRLFLAFLIFDPKWPFCKGYTLWKMADFQNGLISRIFGVFFERFFAQNNSNVLLEWFFACFWNFEFLTQNEHFAKAMVLAWAIAFARWPIFKIVSFLEYLCFFERFFVQNNSNVLLKWFFACFWNFEFLTQNEPFCKGDSLCMGYSLCKMANFQNRLISQIFDVFSSGFLHRTTLMLLKNGFSHAFGIFNFWPNLTILQRPLNGL